MPPVILVTGDDGSNTLQGGAADEVIYGFDPNGPQGQVSSISATRVVSGLTQPLFASAPPGDLDRLFIVEKTGLIKILDFSTSQVLGTPFLDLSTQISAAGEQGLLGLAFHPEFAANGFFYVNLINASGDTEIRRYQVSQANPNVADPASASLVITIDQPAGLTNHKAGWLGFGRDGYLYAALGDGGGGGDPLNSGQDINSLLGKILRFDVNADGFPTDANRNYASPADNPFVGTAGADEIWALGLRNPWRPSFDRALGDFYIADVGQGEWEEINIGASGANYGWKIYEGPDQFSSGTPSAGTLTFPVHAYDHSVGRSITGGYVYRGESEGLHGHYFFADFVQGKLFTLRFNGTSWVATERTGQVVTDAGAIANPSSFGEDGHGNLYVVDFDGKVFRLTPVVASSDQADLIGGGGGADMLFGGSGSDTLEGGPGSDTLIGGPGTDTASYATAAAGVTVDLRLGKGTDGDAQGDILTGIENLVGSAFNDTMLGDAGDNVLGYTGGLDSLDGASGNDTADFSLFGSAVWVDLSYTPMEGWTMDTTQVTSGRWRQMVDLSNVENVTGSNFADELAGDGGANGLDGGAGDDTLYAGLGLDLVNGGTGNDTANFSKFGSAVWVDLSYTPMEGWTMDTTQVTSGTWRQMADLSNVENVTGGDFADDLRGDESANRLDGGAGNDILDSRGGDDTLYLGRGLDVANGGTGTDTADFSRFGSAVWVDLSYTPMEGWTMDSTNVTSGTWRQMADLSNVENVTGSDFADDLRGDESANRLDGDAGNDILDSRGGDDTLYLGRGLDVANGGTGSDTADFSRFGSAVWVDLGYTPMEGWTMDSATVTSGTWRQMADLSNVENVTGSDFADELTGDAAANRLDGGAGNDKLDGGVGDDTLYAGPGLDLVNGGTGNDTANFSRFGSAVWVDLSYTPMEGWTMDSTQVTSGTWRQMADLSNVENVTGSSFADDLRGDGGNNQIEGGGGSDALKGGGGSDTFVYKAIGDRGATFDVVSDFTKGAGGDILDLRDVLSTFSGYNGTNAFAGGYLQFTASGADTLVNLDSDGGANSFTTLATLTNVLLTQADTSNYVA